VLEWTNEGCPYVKKHYSTENMQKTQAVAKADGAVWLSVISSAPGKQGLVYQGAIDDNPSANPATIAGAKNYVLAAMEDLKAGNPVATSDTPPYGCSVKYKS